MPTDTAPLTIRSLRVMPDGLVVSGMPIVVQVTVSGDHAVQLAEVRVAYPDGTEGRYAMQASGGSEYRVEFIVQWDMRRATDTTLRIQARVVDASGNMATAEKTLSTPLLPPESPFSRRSA